jgi:hypothetical protein
MGQLIMVALPVMKPMVRFDRMVNNTLTPQRCGGNGVGAMDKDYRDMSVAEAIAWGCAPGMVEPLNLMSVGIKSARRDRWARRKSKRDAS